MLFALVVAVVLVAWNTATNLVPLPRRWYVPAGFALTGALVAAGRAVGLSWDDLGFGWPQDLRWSAVVVTAVAVVVAGGAALAPRVRWIRGLLDDERADLGDLALAREAFLRIPAGTAFVEEAVFRGVLVAALLETTGVLAATAVSAVAFGLWHVGPTIAALRENGMAPGSARGVRRVIGAVAATTVAGAGFVVLRRVSGGLLAPVLAHWAINAFGLLAAASHQSDVPAASTATPSRPETPPLPRR